MSEPELPVLIADDGELLEVREALAGLGIDFAEAGDEDAKGQVPLLVTSVARAREVLDAGSTPHHFHLVVSDADQKRLEGIPCDFLVCRPVSREILRLLIERARYEGPERRRMTRVALGAPVVIRDAAGQRQAILAQLSVGGCGLVAGFSLEAGSEIVIGFPPELTGPRHLELGGRVISSRHATTADGATFDVSVVFDALGLPDRVTLRALMAGQPIDFRPERAAGPACGSAPRRGARRPPVNGLGGAARIVIGRDLTPEGMRIELDPGLSAGTAIQLALYGSGGAEALLLRGRTEADPNEESWRVRFEAHDEDTARSLAKLRSASDGNAGFVIAEILESDPR